MNLNNPHLLIEIDDKEFIFFVIKFDLNLEFETLYFNKINSHGISKGNVVDIDLASKVIKENIDQIEKKINFIFKESTIIINPNKIESINISGFKKLNGLQISKQDVTYILNDIKKIIKQNEPKKELIHLFNSNFILDKNELKKIPIGLHGEFYNQDMTFFVADKNIFKNIKLVFNFCNININRIILKTFADGIYKISVNNEYNNSINFEFKRSRIITSVFKNKSYVFLDHLNFGTDLIINDVVKICSLEFEAVKFFLKDIEIENLNVEKKDKYLDKKYFGTSLFRKITISHIINIINSRIDEFIDLVLENNTNMIYFKKNNIIVHFSFEDFYLIKFFEMNLNNRKNLKYKIIFNKNNKLSESCLGSAELISKGWENEAIPIIEPKKSIISRLFSFLFD